MQQYEHLQDIPTISTIVVIALGIWGAILNYNIRNKLKPNSSLYRKLIVFFTDLLASSGFALLTFYGLLGYGVNETLSVAIAGIASYQGTNLVYFVDLYIATKLGEKEIIEAVKEEKDETTTQRCNR
jgi:hypothetical protein